MGMAASQARFLGLTARKTNVEYEGQQINQQRTSLANQSANYYNDLLGMTVPTPPSVSEFTKTVYTFQDGNLANSITALIAQPNGEYLVSYTSTWTNDFAPVSAGSAILTRNEADNTYSFGAVELRTLSNSFITVKTTRNGEEVEVPVVMDKGQLKEIKADGTIDTNGKIFENTNVDIYEVTEGGNTKYARREVDPANSNKFIYYEVKLNGEDEIDQSTNQKKLVTPDQDNNKDIVELYQSTSTSSLLGSDPYLKTLSEDQLQKLIQEEVNYKALLDKKYGDTSDWLVRYQQNTATGTWSPVFYKENDVTSAIYSDKGTSQSNIPSYKMGSAQETKEIKGEKARLEKDATGRYINITLRPDADDSVTYSLTTNTLTDQDAYDDAMNQYEYNKHQYDQSINEINAKIEIIQAQDKNLELRLKQLDTEQDAISNEMDAVQKVIEKNTESTFKTFG